MKEVRAVIETLSLTWQGSREQQIAWGKENHSHRNTHTMKIIHIKTSQTFMHFDEVGVELQVLKIQALA